MKANNQQRGPMDRVRRWHLLAIVLSSTSQYCSAFAPPLHVATLSSTLKTQLFHWANRLDNRHEEPTFDAVELPNLKPLSEQFTRRSLLSIGVAGTTLTALLSPLVANADFAPGGTLLDREVSIHHRG